MIPRDSLDLSFAAFFLLTLPPAALPLGRLLDWSTKREGESEGGRKRIIMYVRKEERHNTVKPPIMYTPIKEHLSIKDKSTRPNSYYTSTF